MAISDWPEGERPREKLLDKGPASLTDAELLAIFLRTGVVGKSAVDLARELRDRYSSLSHLFAAELDDFCTVSGIGPAKYVQLQAVWELARRALAEQAHEREVLGSPQAVRDYLRMTLGALPYEVFAIVLLDAQNRLLAVEELFRGTLTQTSVYPREVVKQALRHNAAGIILAHNHPSGVAEPSQADRMLTRQLQDALALVDVRVLDHFVVTSCQVCSFAESGYM